MAESTLPERLARGVGNEIYQHWTGLDDFKRAFGKASSGDILGALKSHLVGSAELGGTIVSLIGAPFTGGGSLALRGAVRGVPLATRLATKAPRAAKLLGGLSRGRQAARAAIGAPRQALIQRVAPLASLQRKMQLTRPTVGTGLEVYDAAKAAQSMQRAQAAGRNPLRALGIIDPFFNYRQLGTFGGRLNLPTSAGYYTRGLARASALVPSAGQGLGSFAVERSVVPSMFEAFSKGRPALAPAPTDLSQQEIAALLQAANLGGPAQPVDPLVQYLGALRSP